jgi:dolichyl-diphosphooligosaccharide--protein glycosyltransferase
VRQQEVGVKGYKLNYFEEAYTSDNWIVRIFKRKKRNNREGLTLISKKAEEV